MQNRELDVAVRQLYDAFAVRQRRPELREDFCAHCVSPREASTLVSTPVSELEPAFLRVFVVNAVSWTWGTPDDLWCCLPRILELVAIGEFGNSDISGLFTSMSACWGDWPEDQRDAVTAYLTALWRAIIGGLRPPAKLGVRDLLEASGDLGVSAEALP